MELPALSQRETEILLLASNGLTDKEISAELSISRGTIRTYWERTREKLGARSRSEAIAIWFRNQKQGDQEDTDAEIAAIRMLVSNAVGYVIVALDTEGHFLTWNPGVLKLFGYDKDEWIGQHLRLIHTQKHRAEGVAEDELRRAAEEGPVNQDYEHRHKNGDPVHLQGTLYPLWNDQLRGFGKIIVVPDQMSAHKRIARATSVQEAGEVTEG